MLATGGFLQSGNAYDDIHQYDKAIADYNDYIQLRPNDPDGYNARADCIDKLGDPEGAKRDRAKAEELTKYATTSSPTATPEGSSSPIATLFPTGSPSLTATPTASNDELARAAFDRGDAARDKSDYQAAIADYSEAIRLKPDYTNSFNNRGDAYCALKQYRKAVDDYSEASGPADARSAASGRFRRLRVPRSQNDRYGASDYACLIRRATVCDYFSTATAIPRKLPAGALVEDYS
jgi:tetratricopeptide (TPR) repeat protein